MKETIFIAVLLVAAIAFFIFFVVFVSNRDKKKEKDKLANRLDELMNKANAKSYKTAFMNKRAIAIDAAGNKLFLLNQVNETEEIHCFDPDQLAFCQVVKSKHGKDGHIRTVELEFTMKDKKVVRFPFFDDQFDSIHDLPQMVKKADQWKQKVNFYKSSRNASNQNEYVA